MTTSSALPEAWVKRIFEKLALAYGRDFLGRWEGQSIEAVMADWAHELRGFHSVPESIKHGLSNLPPDKPPTVFQFRDACLKAPHYLPPALPSPKVAPEVVEAVKAAFHRPPDHHPKAWAHRLQDRQKAGERIPPAHLRMMREALKNEWEQK